jgi:hypothetical protein
MATESGGGGGLMAGIACAEVLRGAGLQAIAATQQMMTNASQDLSLTGT